MRDVFAVMVVVACAACCAALAQPRHQPRRETSQAELLQLLERGHYMQGVGVLADFECAWREAAMTQAKVIQPNLALDRQRILFDALELGASGNDGRGHTHGPCEKPWVFEDFKWAPPQPAHGSAPFPAADDATLLSAKTSDELLSVLRKRPQIAGPVHILLDDGVYRLNETFVLGPEFSDTTISPSTLQGNVEISGSREFTDLSWKAASGFPAGVWAATLPSDVGAVDALRVNGLRATRARYPNANPEFDQFPTGYITGHTDYLKPVINMDTTTVTIPLNGSYPTVDTDGWNDTQWGQYYFAGAYRMGFGGSCDRLTPPQSYWCQPDGRTAGGTYFVRTPSGIQNATRHLPHAPYKNSGKDMVVTYWRPGHWFSIMYNTTAGINSTTGDITFATGGFQGAEGHDSGAEWYIENVAEELDAPNEFFFDKDTSTLYFFFNGTGTPPSTIEVPALTELFVLEGGADTPVRDVTFSSLKFTGQRPTYLEPHGLPSAGDWGMERLAAIRAKGSANLTVTNCTFSRLDGNAVLLDGWNRDAVVEKNEFVLLGASAVVLWGYEHMGDGSGGEQPRGTVMNANFCHELGIWQKQSSCFFQAVSAQSTITNNLFFNGPRALVNFNDNFGGGHDLGHNILFNACRESSDHGAFNSWGRQPYLTDVPGFLSAEPLWSRLHNNFIVANYAADGGCYDNDDGSSWYLEQNNFCVYGGMKSNFEGHAKRSSNNVHAYASVYGDSCLRGINQVSNHYAEGYYNNTCILAKAGDNYIRLSATGPINCTDSRSALHTYIGNNRIYAPSAEISSSFCGKWNSTSWLATGLDRGTTIEDSATVTSAQIIAWGMAALASPNGPPVPPWSLD